MPTRSPVHHPWALELKWRGLVGYESPKPSHSITTGSHFHIMNIGKSTGSNATSDIQLKYQLHAFSRSGDKLKSLASVNNAEGLSLHAQVLNLKDFKTLIVSFETDASVTSIHDAVKFESKPGRVLIFDSDLDADHNYKCLFEQFVVLSHWDGHKFYEGNGNMSYETMFTKPGDLNLRIEIVMKATVVVNIATTQPTSSTAIADFKRMYSSENNFSDIKLKSKDNKIISAHKFVLAARSKYFCDYFKNHKFPNDAVISTDKINSKPLTAILQWMYTDEFPENVENLLEEVLEAAALFQLKDLSSALDGHMIAICNKDNMFQMVQIAKKHSMTVAVNYIKEFIKSNIDAFD